MPNSHTAHIVQVPSALSWRAFVYGYAGMGTVLFHSPLRVRLGPGRFRAAGRFVHSHRSATRTGIGEGLLGRGLIWLSEVLSNHSEGPERRDLSSP